VVEQDRRGCAGTVREIGTERVSTPHRASRRRTNGRSEAAMASDEARVATLELDEAERAWRQGRAAALVTMGALPVLVIAAWLGAGAWTLLFTLPGGPWVVLGVMWLVEQVARVRLARTVAAAPAVAVEATAPAVAA
jgi:hypothetical protein